MRKFVETYIPYLFFALVTLCLAAKAAIWHMQFFNDKVIPVLGCLSMAMLLASGILLCRKRPWWIIVLLFLANLWLFANYAYERAWGHMLSMDMIRMAYNLRGFEDSVMVYFHRDMLYWMVGPDVLCIVGLAFWRRQQTRKWKSFFAVFLAIVWIQPILLRPYYDIALERRSGFNNNIGFAHWWHVKEPLFNIFAWPQDAARDAFMFQEPQNWARPFVYNFSILNYGHAICAFDLRYKKLERTLRNEVIRLTDEQKEQMGHLTNPSSDFIPQRSLVLILVESMENWAIEYPAGDNYVMPNLHRFIYSHNVFYAPLMYCQLGHGGSSDGQLMAITGLLPVRKGVSVALYGDQPFPNYAHYFPNSITLNPSPNVWKQSLVNPNYGIRILEESDSIREDEGVFRRLNTIDFTEPTFVLTITVSSHVPYAKADEVDLPLDPDMPETMARYLKCLHYCDEHLGTFLSRLDADLKGKVDVVITGDHSIFYNYDLNIMKQYAQEKGIACLENSGNATSLILWSPQFTHSTLYQQPAYQMDIYPSILYLIGCENPEWRGVGMDLLGDSIRYLDGTQASELSDKLIRSRYFSTMPE